jgi:hypothetical protein
MCYKFIFLSTFILIGSARSSNPVAPLSFSQSSLSTSDTLNGIVFTFAVSQDTLGIFDTLNMTLSALNQTSQNDTIPVSDYLYRWLLVNDKGITISGGPTVINNLIYNVVVSPNQSATLYRIGYPMADIFNSPIEPGTYSLTWNLWNELSFQLNLVCGRSKNEIVDSLGISSPIYPLRVGNRWMYQTWYQFPNTVIQGDTVAQTVVGEELLDGEKWFLVRSDFNGDQLMTVRQDGIYTYIQNFKEAVLRYKYPAVSNEQYNSAYELWTGYADSLVPFQMSVDSINEPISTPSGSYQCNKYHFPEVIVSIGNASTEVGSEDMFLSNVGPVKIVGGNEYIELISFAEIITKVTNARNAAPDAFQLFQNYPNPCNPSTTISFTLPRQSIVSLKVYDILGREVSTLVSGEMQAGNYTRQWNAENMPSGVYFYRLQAGTYSETKKLLLLR